MGKRFTKNPRATLSLPAFPRFGAGEQLAPIFSLVPPV